MAKHSPNNPDLVPQVQVAVISARYQCLIDKAHRQEAHIDVLEIIVDSALVLESMLGILIYDHRHSKLWLLALILGESSCPCIRICLWYCEFTDLILKIGATKPPEAHVLDATSHEVACATWIEVDVFDLVSERMEQLPHEINFLSRPV